MSGVLVLDATYEDCAWWRAFAPAAAFAPGHC